MEAEFYYDIIPNVFYSQNRGYRLFLLFLCFGIVFLLPLLFVVLEFFKIFIWKQLPVYDFMLLDLSPGLSPLS